MSQQRKNSLVSACCAGVCLALVGMAHAEGMGSLAESWYVGGSLGSSTLEPKTTGSYRVTDDSDTSLEVYGGVDVNRQISLEAYWKDFGAANVEGQNASGKVDYSAMGVNGVFRVPLDERWRLHPYGKLGVASVSTKSDSDIVVDQDKSTVITAGAGVEYDVTKNMRLRTEYNYYNSDLQDISVGMNWGPRVTSIAATPKKAAIPAALPMAKPEPRQTLNVVIQQPAPVPTPKQVSKEYINTNLAGSSLFASGSAQLSGEGYATLSRLINEIRNKRINLNQITITGHTDNVGSHRANQALSIRRAQAVADYLARVGGISRQQMTINGMGERQPVASNATPQGKAQNRRVSVTVTGSEVVTR